MGHVPWRRNGRIIHASAFTSASGRTILSPAGPPPGAAVGDRTMTNRLLSLAVLACLGLAGFASFRVLEASLEADVYRERIAVLAADHEQLRQLYNRAVRRTAVTELRVEDGVLSVVVRRADGQIQVLPSPYDPNKEIYVDFIVRDGRLWIRRLFDEDTAPGNGMLVDSQLADVDWDAPGAAYGKAAYRSLPEGRWVVDVTGDGSLGLSGRGEADVVELSPAPPVRDYEPVEAEVRDALRAIGPIEAIRVIGRRLAARSAPGGAS